MANKILFLFILSLNACSTGWIYTNIKEPYCTDMVNSLNSGRSSFEGLKSVSLPRLPGARAVWSSNSIADAAKNAGIKTIYYCDRERFSLLGGIWGKDRIIVYGE